MPTVFSSAFCCIYLYKWHVYTHKCHLVLITLTPPVHNKAIRSWFQTWRVFWKVANVIPLYKCGNMSAAKKYRPISLTSVVMERIVCRPFLKKHRNNKIKILTHMHIVHKPCPFAEISPRYFNVECCREHL